MEAVIEKIGGKEKVVIKNKCQSFTLEYDDDLEFIKNMANYMITSYNKKYLEGLILHALHNEGFMSTDEIIKSYTEKQTVTKCNKV